MGYVKFTFINLSVNCLTLIGLILFVSPKSGLAEINTTIHISVSKSEAKTQDVTKSDITLAGSDADFQNNDFPYFVASLSTGVNSGASTGSTFSENRYLKVQEDHNKTNSTSGDLSRKPNKSKVIGGDSTEKTTGKSFLNLFLSDEEIAAFKRDILKYGNDHIPESIRGYYVAVVEKSFQYSAIFIFVGLILFFIINLIVVLNIFNYSIRRKKYKEKFERIYGKMYEGVLMSYMFGEIDWEAAVKKLKKGNKRANRKLLVSLLLNFKANFKGEFENIIQEIYLKLNLHRDSLKLAHSVKDYKKVKGIMELTHLYPEGAKEIITKLINHPDDYVRAEAQTAYIGLNTEAPFNFFYTLERPFTKWTQLSAFNLIRQYQLPVPSFAKFLEFQHLNIRNFSLRMIIFFQQLENVPEILKMVDSKMEVTRFLCYKAINDLRLYDSRELIKNKFFGETEKNKLEIVKAFKNIGLKEDFEFLLNVMKTGSVSLKTEACRSMYFMNQEGSEILLNTDSNSIPEIELLVAHVTDPRN